MATQSWDVGTAVASVIRAINEGAPGIDLAKDAEQDLTAYYTETFQAMHDEGEDWYADRPVVLVLARGVGMLGAFFELLHSMPDEPKALSLDSALLAAYVIAASKICPKKGGRVPSGSLVKRGGWCRPPTPQESTPQIRQMVAALAPLVRPAIERSSGKVDGAESRP